MSESSSSPEASPFDASVPPPPPPPAYTPAEEVIDTQTAGPIPPPMIPVPQHASVGGFGQQVPVFNGPAGKVRSTGLCIFLAFITLGIYPLFWFYAVHNEMKRHSNQGLDGGIAAILAFFVGIVMVYITPNDVGNLYELRGMRKPVSAATGLWYFPGMFLLVGPIIWFVKTNGAVNAYWRSLGAVA